MDKDKDYKDCHICMASDKASDKLEYNKKQYHIEDCNRMSDSNSKVIVMPWKNAHLGGPKSQSTNWDFREISNIMYDNHNLVLFRAKNGLGFSCQKSYVNKLRWQERIQIFFQLWTK